MSTALKSQTCHLASCCLLLSSSAINLRIGHAQAQYQVVEGGTEAYYNLIPSYSGVLEFLVLPPPASFCDVANDALARPEALLCH